MFCLKKGQHDARMCLSLPLVSFFVLRLSLAAAARSHRAFKTFARPRALLATDAGGAQYRAEYFRAGILLLGRIKRGGKGRQRERAREQPTFLAGWGARWRALRTQVLPPPQPIASLGLFSSSIE